MAYPKTLAALREQEDQSWGIADALVAEIKVVGTKVYAGEFVRCAEWLAAQGYDVTPDWLSKMRNTALRFPPSEGGSGDRPWPVPFRLYIAASQSAKWTPELMDQAVAERWTLRQFSEKLTGKPWADDDREAVKRMMTDPEKLIEVLRQVPVEIQVQVARQMLSTPEVVQRTISHPETRGQVEAAQQRQQQSYQRQQAYLPPVPVMPSLPAVPPQPYKQALPDPAVQDQEQSRRLLDDRADIATVTAIYQRVYSRGSEVPEDGREVLADDLDRAAKWHEAVTALLTGNPLDRELADFLNGESQ
jgi:hypothetical protein